MPDPTADSTATLRRFFSHAILNDTRDGVISEEDARSLVTKALSALSTASDPAALHARQERLLAAARLLVGDDPDAASLLDNYARRGDVIVQQRLSGGAPAEAPASSAPQLPAELWPAFLELVHGQEALGELDGALVQGEARFDGARWSVAWTAGSASGGFWGLPWREAWVLSPVPLPPEALRLAQGLLHAYLLREFVPNGLDEAALSDLTPWHVLWPAEEDPTGLGASYPAVARFHNRTGSDHGFYVGVNVDAGEGRAEAFN